METIKINAKHDLTERGANRELEVEAHTVAVQFALKVVNIDESAVSRVDVQHLNAAGGVLLTQSCHMRGAATYGVRQSNTAFPVSIDDLPGNQTKTLRFINHGAVNGSEPSKVELTILSETANDSTN